MNRVFVPQPLWIRNESSSGENPGPTEMSNGYLASVKDLLRGRSEKLCVLSGIGFLGAGIVLRCTGSSVALAAGLASGVAALAFAFNSWKYNKE
ncbi:MAG: hypothetical protein PHG63_02435 [Candidatus Dojkabacteria bacterium]|nr:hypothetical protein [Candidatus Dojkabacteria bacterium]